MAALPVGPPGALVAGSSNWASLAPPASDPTLARLFDGLRSSALGNWADSSVTTYRSPWNMFVEWCRARSPPLTPLPASELTVALFLQQRLEDSRTYAPVKAASAAIAMMHKVNAFDHRPTATLLPSLVRRAARRKFGIAATRDKEPLLWRDVMQLAVHCAPTRPLCWACIALAALVCFAGFCRYNDAALLRWDHAVFSDTHLELTFTQRKNNQYKLKQRVRIARTPSAPVCVPSLLLAWRSRTMSSPSGPIFRGFDGRAANRDPAATPLLPNVLPYEQYARYLRRLLVPILGLPEDEIQRRFGTHSCRSGGASAAANAGIPFEVWGQHGAWRSRSAQLVYMGLDLDRCLSTTRTILGSEANTMQAVCEVSDSDEDDAAAADTADAE